jgi:addiction module HigA family antidote
MEEKVYSIGKFLHEKFLIPFNISQSFLAKALHISRTRINEIIKGKRTITADTDLRLCKFFGLEEGYFLKLQTEIDIKKAKESLKKVLLNIEPRKESFTSKQIIFDQKLSPDKLKVAVICGGPSLERGISLNSARSVIDHLSREEVEIFPIYVDVYKNFYFLSKSQLYSNTPSDFDFKLHSAAKKVSENELLDKLKKMDVVFPIIHGKFGEDGELQAFLEKNNIPFVGSSSLTCQKMFDKHSAFFILERHGYATIPTEILRKGSLDLEKNITNFFQKYTLGRVVVKPIAGGSSIGVFSAYSPKEATEKTLKLFENNLGEEALVEPFCFGKEFTIIVLQNPDGSPVALIPTEIQVNYDGGEIFDYRRKYLPSQNTFWFCPPRFEDKIVEDIRKKAEELFKLFNMRDFARLDGWLLNDGRVIFSDFNPISGMEQNSFIFQQASRIGLTHGDLLWNILCNACSRYNIKVKQRHNTLEEKKEPLHVLFGGSTAERQVSLMSGTNVWLKLRKSKKYQPEPYLLDFSNCVWHLPYSFSLNHTVEEIYENCLTAPATVERLERFLLDIKKRLIYAPKNFDVKKNLPKQLSFDEFIKISKEKNAFVFLALHGGEGENGAVQQKLEENNLLYNGSNPKTSELCMDKYLTGAAISKMGDEKILTVPKKQIKMSSFNNFTKMDFENFWFSLQKELTSKTFIIKPQKDGCSSGIVRLFSHEDLQKYIDFVRKKISTIPPNSFKNQAAPIEMPLKFEDDYLIEMFVETDFIRIFKNELVHKIKTGWIELTVGVIEKNGLYHSLNPSITISEGEVLSVEEKFQGGTGINITPPLESIISQSSLKSIKKNVEKIAKNLSIENYARMDLFFNVKTKITYLIEVNTLPALTPSTVLFHQALAEKNSIYPREFLESLIETKKNASIAAKS